MSLTPYFTTHYLAKIMLQYDNNLSKKSNLARDLMQMDQKLRIMRTCKSGKDAMRHGMTLTMKIN